MCRWIGSPDGSPSTRSRRARSSGRRTGGEAGFTLIEVLVAFSVLAVVMVPLLQVFGDGLGTTQTARSYARAALLARSKLAEIGVDAPLKEGEETGSFEDAGFQWRTRVVPDTSEVIAPPPPPGSRERRRSRDGDRTGSGSGTGSDRSRSGFARSGSRSVSDGDSGFGRGGSGFGGSRRRSGFGQSGGRDDGFGSSRSSGFGQGRSGSGFGSQGDAGATGGLDDEDQPPEEPSLLLYRVIVTVEWGQGGGNSLTLSTLRARRPDDGSGDDEEQGTGSAFGRGSGSDRDSGRDRGRERSSGFGSRSGGSGSGFGSRSGLGSGGSR